MTYIIRKINKETGVVSVEYDDKVFIAFPLPVDNEGMVPEGSELDIFINKMRPQPPIIKDIKNIEIIEALVQHAHPPLPTWDQIRSMRNKFLIESDWTQLPDVALSAGQKSERVNYRNLLRDITVDFDDTGSVIWPVPPDQILNQDSVDDLANA